MSRPFVPLSRSARKRTIQTFSQSAASRPRGESASPWGDHPCGPPAPLNPTPWTLLTFVCCARVWCRLISQRGQAWLVRCLRLPRQRGMPSCEAFGASCSQIFCTKICGLEGEEETHGLHFFQMKFHYSVVSVMQLRGDKASVLWTTFSKAECVIPHQC